MVLEAAACHASHPHNPQAGRRSFPGRLGLWRRSGGPGRVVAFKPIHGLPTPSSTGRRSQRPQARSCPSTAGPDIRTQASTGAPPRRTGLLHPCFRPSRWRPTIPCNPLHGALQGTRQKQCKFQSCHSRPRDRNRGHMPGKTSLQFDRGCGGTTSTTTSRTSPAPSA